MTKFISRYIHVRIRSLSRILHYNMYDKRNTNECLSTRPFVLNTWQTLISPDNSHYAQIICDMGHLNMVSACSSKANTDLVTGVKRMRIN